MKLYWTLITEASKKEPEIFEATIDENGMFIGAPGTLIFRTREEAKAAITKARAIRNGGGWM